MPWRATWREMHTCPPIPVRGMYTVRLPVLVHPPAFHCACHRLDTCDGHDLRNRDPGGTSLNCERNKSVARIGPEAKSAAPRPVSRATYQLAGAKRAWRRETRGDERLEFRRAGTNKFTRSPATVFLICSAPTLARTPAEAELMHGRNSRFPDRRGGP